MTIDWQALKNLRQKFITNNFSHKSYWQSHSLIESYDQTFAQRISWKWQRVLEEIQHRDIQLPAKLDNIIDWGCGTGIASRTFLGVFPDQQFSHQILIDKSTDACQFAAEKITGLGLQQEITINPASLTSKNSLLLISHVLNELNPDSLSDLLALINDSDFFIWVENGTKSTSKQLSSLIPQIAESQQILAPCMTPMNCPMNTADHDDDWCHNFARIPQEAAEQSLWGHVKTQLGIDTRSAPYSFLVGSKQAQAVSLENSFRVLGRPQINKGHLKAQCCSASGLSKRTFSKTRSPQTFKSLKKQKSLDVFQE